MTSKTGEIVVGVLTICILGGLILAVLAVLFALYFVFWGVVSTIIIFALSKAGLIAFSWWTSLALAIFLMVFGGVVVKIKR